MVERLTRQEQRTRNRLRLLEAAEKVFAERGIQGASLDEVAAEAGLTKGAVYSNFAGKEELVLAVMWHRLGEEEQAQADLLMCADRPADDLVKMYGEHWAATARGGDQDLYARVAVEFMVYATRHPGIREELLTLLFPPTEMRRHPLAPPGSALADLPPEQADAILKSLDIGMRLLTLLAPEHCPPELFPTALDLLTSPKADSSPEG
ncbi:helix-turn-helix domain-containing protein [Nonomuraea sp. NPDC046570]|uniref:TetR/AcrR family transcriptional regulator n=1 Tax=Nonomuraea sp. NPDC046570 TaxID=3155255 RepID=UPI0033C0E91D